MLTHDFLDTYNIWYHHGEQYDDIEDEMNFSNADEYVDDEPNNLAAGLNDVIGSI